MNAGTNHAQGHPRVVTVPKWIFFIHIAQALLALIVLGLVSYSLHVYNSLNINSYYDFSFPVNTPCCFLSKARDAAR